MHTAIAALLGSVIGAGAPYLAAQRSAAQPSGARPVEEAQVIGAVLADPSHFRTAAVLEPAVFVWPAHRSLWETLLELAVPDPDPAHIAEAEAADAPSIMLEFGAEELREELDARNALAGVDPAALEATPLTSKAFLAAGGRVLLAAGDREMVGAVPPVVGYTPARSLYRRVVAPTGRRVVVTALCSAVALGLVAAAGTPLLGIAAAAVLVAGSAVAALVDIDTMYVDFRSLVATAVVGIAVACAAAGDELATNALFAFVAVVGIVGSLELIAWVWSKIRHQVGLGGGDSMLLVPILAIPVLVSGRAEAGLWGLIVALLLTVVAQGALIAVGRSTRSTQFPWVPYLVCGWPLGWYLAVKFGVY